MPTETVAPFGYETLLHARSATPARCSPKPLKGASVELDRDSPRHHNQQLRRGLHNTLGQAALDVSQVATRADRERNPAQYTPPLGRLKRTCRLLDVIGWGGPPHATATQIDLQDHSDALTDGLEMTLRTAEGEVEEIEEIDAARTAKHQPPVRETIIRRSLELHQYADTVKDAIEAIQ